LHLQVGSDYATVNVRGWYFGLVFKGAGKRAKRLNQFQSFIVHVQEPPKALVGTLAELAILGKEKIIDLRESM
jgi:hypothetical protein